MNGLFTHREAARRLEAPQRKPPPHRRHLPSGRNDPHPPITAEEYAAARAALAHKGVGLVFRLLGQHELPYGRFLDSLGRAVNMLPFAAAYDKPVRLSKYTLSATDCALFETHW
ncbi:hypothetical protein [uncultured Thermanaerothrix sp.]|uniref:hypothetical protein n=1 Tax=uncultured Thermanaerothrix sp. TaxID=1195149 RepID=UPI00261200B2|nr:hypothetical protein [uncultured Thermanaerothrix sp.]